MSAGLRDGERWCGMYRAKVVLMQSVGVVLILILFGVTGWYLFTVFSLGYAIIERLLGFIF